MTFAYFAIFRQDGRACLSRQLVPEGKQWPCAFHYENRIYLPKPVELCDGDGRHLLNADGELIGFTFSLGATEVGHGRLVKECANVESEAGSWLRFLLAESGSCQNHRCNYLYPFLYSDGQADHIVMVGECLRCWSGLGVRLASPPVPEAIFELTSLERLMAGN